ncbi:MAG: rhodanese-like domain-containing protein [Solobacterium sp.]|nr:rhodanese-like domain-containing protein [Solobacterium sp.]
MKHHEPSLIRRISAVLFTLFLSACTNRNNAWQSISQSQAMEIMENRRDIIILDVRTEEEYAGEHILNAVNLPNESIGTQPPALLPDRDQIILVYCRTGVRAKQAAQKLADLGYTNVKEFGGITDWKGPTESWAQFIQPVLMLDRHSPAETEGIVTEVTGYSEGQLEITLQNHSGNTWYYGEAFDLSMKEAGAWHRLAWPDGKAWIEIAYELNDGEEIILRRDISGLEPLDPGEYLLSMNGAEAQFELVMSE